MDRVKGGRGGERAEVVRRIGGGGGVVGQEGGDGSALVG